MDFREYDTRLAAYALLTDGVGRVLLALWNEASEPLWTMPGGGVELHETVAEAAVREVREETGYEIELDELLGISSRVIDPAVEPTTIPEKTQLLRIVYRAHVVPPSSVGLAAGYSPVLHVVMG